MGYGKTYVSPIGIESEREDKKEKFPFLTTLTLEGKNRIPQ